MNKKTIDPILRSVWENAQDKRYIPRGNGNGYGWDIWDQRSGVWVKGLNKILEIDPSEPLRLS